MLNALVVVSGVPRHTRQRAYDHVDKVLDNGTNRLARDPCRRSKRLDIERLVAFRNRGQNLKGMAITKDGSGERPDLFGWIALVLSPLHGVRVTESVL